MKDSRNVEVGVEIHEPKDLLDRLYDFNWWVGLALAEEQYQPTCTKDVQWMRNLQDACREAIQSYPHNAFNM